MGKKRTVNKAQTNTRNRRSVPLTKIPKKKLLDGIVIIESTQNNTRITFTELNGNVVLWSSSSVLGFNGAQKSTPLAATQVAEVIAEKAQLIGVKDIHVVMKGVGSGRESALRFFINRGFNVLSIKDKTPIPHNGPKRRKPRRG